MKPSEIVNLGEGPLDWMARKGFLGKSKQISAVGSQLDKEQAAMQSAAEKSLAAQKQRQFQQFLVNLPVAIARAYQSSVVAESSLNKNNYEKFDRLIESLILNESMNVTDFMKQYIKNLAGKIQISPDVQNTIDALIADFVTKFTYDPAKTPEQHKLTPEATQVVTKIWDAIQTARTVQGAPSKPGLGSSYGYPKADVVIDIQGNDYKFTMADKKWKDEAGAEITDTSSIQQLNKAAYDQSKRKSAAITPPTKPVTITFRSVNYSFTPGTGTAPGKWTRPDGTEVDKPESIELLNREAADVL